MWLIVGLGNPGKKYTHTRHNAGAMLVDALHTKVNASPWTEKKEWRALVSEYTHDTGAKIRLAKPTAYMNESGESIRHIAEYFRIPPDHIIVAHDDKDIFFGEIKAQFDRGHAGHNGVRSVIQTLGTQAFHRIRIGIGKEKIIDKDAVPDFVLSSFSLLEKLRLPRVLSSGIEMLDNALRGNTL
jgi:peptidyl-tRNA hydrolase, PTH1 family